MISKLQPDDRGRARPQPGKCPHLFSNSGVGSFSSPSSLLIKKDQRSLVVGRICEDLGPDCSLFVKSTKFSGMTELIMTINM